jgi:hypothetical protein
MVGYELFLQQLDESIRQFPKLGRIERDGVVILKGELEVIDTFGKYWDSYTVEIHHSDTFPFRFPILYEVGGKIPQIGDWHINEDTKSCCIKVLPAELITCKNGITLTGFIQQEVLPYLFNQTHRRVEGYYVNGEYSHGIHGIYEFYSRLLNTGDSIKKTLTLMTYVASNPKPERTSLCFCGSGIKYRKCHRDAFEQLALVDKKDLIAHYYLIASKAGLLSK